jgi:hypothetical protein
MANVKAVIIRRNSSPKVRIITTPKSVNLRQEGLRASDNMEMLLSAEHAVEQGDEIYYIQDVLDVDNLRGVWNFYGGFRDESGFEHDDMYTAPYTMPACVHSVVSSDSDIDWRHKGYYKFKIVTNSNDGIKIEKKFKNNNTDAATKVPVIDMSGDFDMIFEFKTNSSSDGQTLFDNYDHATSSGKGLKIVINSSSTNITITADDGTTETVMVAGSITTNGVVTFVRIRRKAGVFKLYLDGVEKSLTNNTNAGNFNSNQDIHFFKEYNESTSAYIANTGWNGVPIQFRLYNVALPDDEVKKLRVSKPVNTTMKFGGRIWKLENTGSSKKLVCSSHAKELLGSQITSSTFAALPVSVISGGGARKNNRYYETSGGRPDMEEIIKDILKYVDGGVYSYFSEHPSTSFQGDFFAEGSLLDILKVMLTIDPQDHMFVVTARKILFISLEVSANQIISNQNYDIVDSGKDDTSTTNSMYTSGRKRMYGYTKTFNNISTSANTWTTAQAFLAQDSFTPVVERISKVTRDGTEIYQDGRNNHTYLHTGDTTVNTFRLLDDNTIQFYSTDASSHTYIIYYEYTYTYDPTATYSLAFATTQHREDSTSITNNGLYHRNFHIPQLTSGLDVTTFNTKYIASFKDIHTRQRAISGSLINSLTVGQKVRYTRYDKQTDAWITVEKVVRSIEYSYPQTMTTIELGEYMFSGFDVEKQTIDSVRALDSSTSVSRY